MTPALLERVGGELTAACPPAIRAMAEDLARLGGPGVAAVLYYGSSLRAGAPEGVLDFYVLLDEQRAWPRNRLSALANAVLPPNVEYREMDAGGRRLRGKIALVTVRQFERLVQGRGLDTTVWARFCQPSLLAWSRDAAAEATTVKAVAQAVVTAGRWAALLGPGSAHAEDYWDALFGQTYAAEFRVERKGREKALLAFAADRYRSITPTAWRAAGIAFEADGDGLLRPTVTPADRSSARAAWRRRRLAGKPLNLLRLLKAAFTFQGATRYAAYKIEKHTGLKLAVTPWQERHPLLASPGLLWRLWREGALR